MRAELHRPPRTRNITLRPRSVSAPDLTQSLPARPGDSVDDIDTPALVVDEVVKVSGRMPSKDELLGWLSAG